MSTAHVKPLSELIDPGWAAALADVEPVVHAMGDFLRAELAAGRHYLPASRNILRAFTIPFDSIKVLIVGQDPYPTPGHPVGLSFCVAPDVRPLPKSLINIYKELVSDLGVPAPANGDLTPWTEQGVMLLNRCLTVQVGRPNSHQGKGWEQVTDAAIRALNARTDEQGRPKPLADVEPVVHAMGDFLRAELAAGRHYLPASRNILRAFTIPFDSIKVLIVGQDPYPTPGHPVGLSFCVAPDVRPLPKSLINIYKELVSDLGVPAPANGDLTPWTEQGVMLLNRCLTVQVGRPNSHQGKGWEQVTDAAIRALNARTDEQGRPKPLVAILWGRNAQTLEPLLTNAFIIKSPHPSPLSASRGFFGSRPFSRTNQALASMGAKPVDWALPAADVPNQPLQ